MTPVSDEYDLQVPCLCGCGALVGEGQEFPACPARAVDDWLQRWKRRWS